MFTRKMLIKLIFTRYVHEVCFSKTGLYEIALHEAEPDKTGLDATGLYETHVQ